MQSFLGFEISSAVQYLIALIIIFALLVAFAVVLRRITAPGARGANQASSRSRQPRLAVVDTFDLDQRRQLILLRRDNVEHLVMVGGPTDIVVESGILRGGQRALQPVGSLQSATDEPPQLPLDIALSTLGRGTAGEAAAEGAPEPASQRRSDTQFTPLPDLRQASAADRRKPAPPPAAPTRDPFGGFKREASAAAEKPSAERPASADMGDLAAPPGAPPRSAPAATARPPEPAQPARPVSPLAEPKPAPSRPDTPQSSPARPAPARPSSVRADATGSGAATESEPMSAMARELERALQRPFSSVRPNTPAGPTSPPRPGVSPAKISAGDTSSEGAVASSAPLTVGAAGETAVSSATGARPRTTAPWDQLSAATKRPAPSGAASATAPLMDRPAAQQPGLPAANPLSPAAAKASPAPARNEAGRSETPVSEATATPAAKPNVDPFSVDDIEAEFARLLGRSPPTR